mgnify:CR=1 FL=1
MSSARAASSPAAGGSAGRIIGLDAARAAAILGMLAVNVGPLADDALAGKVMRIPHGRASLLFVLLAGIGYSLLTRHARAGGPLPWRQVVWRAVFLGLIGLSTQLLGHGVDVILTVYAALFLLALILARAPTWSLLALVAVTALLGPVVWLALQHATGQVFDREAPTLLDPPVQILAATFLTGPYPVLTWLAPFVFGMWLGRLALDDRRLQLRLAGWGLVVALVAEAVARFAEVVVGPTGEDPGTDWLLSSVAHSQMPLWLIGGTAAAVAVLGGMLLALPHLGRLGWPLVATGQLALTVYVVHLFAVAWLVRPGPQTAAGGLVISMVMAVVFIAACTIWLRFWSRGPLEALLRLPSRRAT